jgi:hypothetical protein
MTSTVAGSGEPIQAAADGDPTWASWVGYDRIAVGVLVVALVIVVATFRNYGVTWDEPGLRTYGRMLVDWYASGFTDGRAFEFANLRYYGGGFDIVATLLEPLVPLDA